LPLRLAAVASCMRLRLVCHSGVTPTTLAAPPHLTELVTAFTAPRHTLYWSVPPHAAPPPAIAGGEPSPVHRMRPKTHHWVRLGAQSTWVPSPSPEYSPSSSCATGPPSPASVPMTARARVPAPLSCLARLGRFCGSGCPAAGLSPAQRRGPVAHPPWPVVLGFLFFSEI
jgi:hypothetical protein